MQTNPMHRCMALSALLMAGVPAALFAQAGKPVRLIVPFPAGATADVLSRIVADKLRGQFPAGVIVEKRTAPVHRRAHRPAMPWTRAESRLLLIALESGNFSSVDFFAEALTQVA